MMSNKRAYIEYNIVPNIMKYYILNDANVFLLTLEDIICCWVERQLLKSYQGMGGGREVQDGGDIYLWMIHVDVWRKPTQYCKAIILQLKIN